MKIKLSKNQWEDAGKKAGWMKIAQIEGGVVDSNLKSTSNPLNGMTKVRATRYIGKLIDKYTKGLFSDEYWEPVNKIFQELSSNNISYVVKSAEYRENEKGTPIAKTWRFEIEFLNEKNKSSILYGNITASGAGTVANPLEKYDIIAYVS